MPIKAILFGSIGTLVETSEFQRQAFNTAFSEAGLDWKWDINDYKDLLEKSGGKRRITDYATKTQTDVDAEQLHRRKTEVFDAMMLKQGSTLRPGVQDIIETAKGRGVKLAFVTSTSQENVDALFKSLASQVSRDDFDFVGNAGMVENSKPASDIYNVALHALDIGSDECVAVEDTAESMQAATGAGIKCVAFPGAYANISSFGDPKMIVEKLVFDDLYGNT